MQPSTSLRRRLSLYLGGGLAAVLLAVIVLGAAAAMHEINEVEDSRMSQLARTLLQLAPGLEGSASTVDLKHLLPSAHELESNNGFAVWNAQGTLLTADRQGANIPYQNTSAWRNNRPLWQGGAWRYLYLHDAQTGYTVAVSQRLKERISTMVNTLTIQLGLMVVLLPLLLWLVHTGIRRGLQPLAALQQELAQRRAGSLAPVSEDVPAETKPLVQAVNALMARMAAAIEREQRFTSDAAHELRSPLAALRVQAEALALSDNANEQAHHLANIRHSVEQAQRLTDQLLVLARIDPLTQLPEREVLDWQAISHTVMQSVSLAAREKRIRLKLECADGFAAVAPRQGNPVLLQLMLRNLLDNAIRYSPQQSTVTLQLGADGLRVCDQGGGIAPEHLPRIRERFYRPAGQSQSGSGLGLAIVEAVAALHDLTMTLDNHPGHGLCVILVPKEASGSSASTTASTSAPNTATPNTPKTESPTP